MRKRWASLAPLDKQLAFVASVCLGTFLALGFAVGIAGHWEPLLGLALALLIIVAVIGLWAVATRLFPDKRNEEAP